MRHSGDPRAVRSDSRRSVPLDGRRLVDEIEHGGGHVGVPTSRRHALVAMPVTP
jgi:hypothetical protein